MIPALPSGCSQYHAKAQFGDEHDSVLKFFAKAHTAGQLGSWVQLLDTCCAKPAPSHALLGESMLLLLELLVCVPSLGAQYAQQCAAGGWLVTHLMECTDAEVRSKAAQVELHAYKCCGAVD